MAQLRVAATRESGAEEATQRPVAPAEHREELAGALAAAVERLRARAEAAASESEADELLDAPASESGGLAESPASEPAAELDRPPATAAAQRAPHKHSMSLLRRAQLRRKQRRERRLAKTEPPRIQSQ